MIPFDHILGNNQAQLAIILTLVQPASCSLLISGESGTGKTSLLRSLYSIMSEDDNMSIVNIPTSTTLEMLSDFVNTDLLIKSGKVHYKKGLLHRLNGKIVLMDNVNLHDRVVVKSILDYQSGCKADNAFKVIATINPNEGGISSAILDQFDLFVELKTLDDVVMRKQLIQSALDYVNSAVPFSSAIYEMIQKSQVLAQNVKIDEGLLSLISKTCQDYFVLGHRGDIALLNATLAHAAWMGKSRAERGDLQAVQELALAHRRLNYSPELDELKPDESEEKTENKQTENKPSGDEHMKDLGNNSLPVGSSQSDHDGPQSLNNEARLEFDSSANSQEHQESPQEFYLEYDPLDRLGRLSRVDTGFGSRIKSMQNNDRGSYRRAVPDPNGYDDIAFSATIRAAAPFQRHRRKKANVPEPKILLEPSDYRRQVKQHRTGYHILFVVDASGSMGVNQRMKKVKGLIFELLKNSYVKRDRVGMLAFRGDSCEVILPFTKSISKAYDLLKDIKTGGRTPLYLGMCKASEVIQAQRRREKQLAPVILLLTDGRATSSYKSENSDVELINIGKQLKKGSAKTIVIDTEEGFIKLGLARHLAKSIDAHYYTLDQLDTYKIYE